MASKVSKALQAAGTKLRNTAAELETVKRFRSMDKAEQKKTLQVLGVASLGGAAVGYKVEEKIQTSEKISADSVLKKGVYGIPITTIVGAAGAFVAAKKMSGQKAVAVAAFSGGAAGGALAYKWAHEA